METEKKPWTKPELIVLARSKPEEAVLEVCKGGAYSGAPGNQATNCLYVVECSACSAWSAS